VRSEGFVEAARMCRRLGLDEEALTCYERALGATGWGTVFAAIDRGQQLTSEGRFDDAIAMLTPLTTGAKGPVAAGYGLYFMATTYRLRGDLANAGRCARLALAEASRVTDGPGSGQCAAVAELAEDLLAYLARVERRRAEADGGR
jgi:tetratricopeptide (TPR) repeat protein